MDFFEALQQFFDVCEKALGEKPLEIIVSRTFLEKVHGKEICDRTPKGVLLLLKYIHGGDEISFKEKGT